MIPSFALTTLHEALLRAEGDGRLRGVRDLALLNEPLCAAALLSTALAGGSAGAAATEAIAAITDGLADATLAALERAARSARIVEWLPSVATPAEIARAALSGGAAHAALGVASFGRDGYVREAATRALSERCDARAVRFLMLRLDDTALSVFRLADDALGRRFAESSPDARVSALPMLVVLAERQRAWSSPAMGVLRGLVDAPDAAQRQAIARGMKSSSPALRDACARVISQRSAEDVDGLREALTQALESPEARTRRWAIDRIFKRGSVPERVLVEVLPTIERSADAGMRVRAVRVRARTRNPDEALVRAAFDAHAAVRLAAREGLHAVKSFVDLRALACETLAATPERAVPEVLGALGVLSDIGRAEEAPWVQRYLLDARPRVRAAALDAVSTMAPALYLDVARDALREGSRVSTAAVRVYVCAGSAVDPDEVLEALPRVGSAARRTLLQTLWRTDVTRTLRALIPRLAALEAVVWRVSRPPWAIVLYRIEHEAGAVTDVDAVCALLREAKATSEIRDAATRVLMLLSARRRR